MLFSDRRKALIKKMKPGSLTVLFSNEAMPRSGDQHFPFRQDSSLFALTGIDQPGTILVLFPNAQKESDREILFILPQEPEHTIWNGERLTKAQARKISGIRSVYETDRFAKKTESLANMARLVLTNKIVPGSSETNHPISNHPQAKALLSKYPDHKFESIDPMLAGIRMVKHPEEITLMKQAIDVTAGAFQRVLQSIRPGMKEFEVEAVLTYHLARYGCSHAFEPIVASGQSACTLHYVKNNGVLRAGELVLIDFGAEYACMASDMTRTIPVTGVFTKRQKQVYQSVLHVLEEVTDMMRPGITLMELNQEAGKLIDAELVKLRLVTKTDLRQQDPDRPIRRRYFMHGVSHHLGYDVHDLSDRSVPLKAGMVLTCEPGLYIPEEKMGIRLENDILITRGKPKNLMAGVPLDPDEIEDMMRP